MESILERISRILREEDGFLVTAHVNPDGDALGSTAAMGYVLTALGKRFTLYNPTGMIQRFDWLPLPGPLTTTLPTERPRVFIVLDSGDPRRVGQAMYDYMAQGGRIIVIDHHKGTPESGEVNWIDTWFPSVGEMVARLARHLGIPLVGPIAQAIYLAMVTDTGYFSFGNTKPETLELAAELLRNGLDAASLNVLIQGRWRLNRFQLLGAALQRIHLYYDGSVGTVSIPRALMQLTQTGAEDCEGVVNSVRQIEGIKVAVSLREDAPDFIKFSLRSWGATDVQVVARKFGGGGHKNAAGGEIAAPLEEAERMLVEAVGESLGFIG